MVISYIKATILVLIGDINMLNNNKYFIALCISLNRLKYGLSPTMCKFHLVLNFHRKQ